MSQLVPLCPSCGQFTRGPLADTDDGPMCPVCFEGWEIENRCDRCDGDGRADCPLCQGCGLPYSGPPDAGWCSHCAGSGVVVCDCVDEPPEDW